MSTAPKTLQEAIIYFADFENCQKFMTELRWSDGKVRCPQCGSEHVTYLAKARVWKCYGKHERPKFSLKVGTIFEDSAISLSKWLTAVWLIVNCKNGISSYEVGRDIGVSQKSAWHMLHRIRKAMQDDLTGGTLAGEIEVDESMIGGKARNMHRSRRIKADVQGPSKGKTIVLGILERKGRVRATVIPDRTKKVMQENVRPHVEPGSQIFSDEAGDYWKMDGFSHETVNHAETYVRGNVHTNGLENFWSLLKRGLHGTYVSVEPFHLFRYIDEQAFRYNNRKPMDDSMRFTYVMRKIVGKRLTWNELTGKQPELQTCLN
jgi:transposase-like protein